MSRPTKVFASSKRVMASAVYIAWFTSCAGTAIAEKDDRVEPVRLSFARKGEANLASGSAEIAGDVVLSQGSMVLRAERATIRETPDGFFQASASGAEGKQVSFRQDRSIPVESVEGTSDNLLYDASSSTARLEGNARLRQVSGAHVKMELTGTSVVFDKRGDAVSVESGSNGRARIVFMPLFPKDSNSDDGVSAAFPLKLQPTLTLGQRE